MGFDLYPGNYNTLIEKPERPVQKVVAVVGVGAIGAEIGYYLKDALPDSEPYLVDILEKPLENNRKRGEGYIQKAIEDAACAPTLEEALEVSYKAFGHVACTEAAKEGISAFLEKRPRSLRIDEATSFGPLCNDEP